MAKLNKKCRACGTKYSYCPDCSRADALKPTWYNDFCSEPCKELWYTLTRYNMERLTKTEAKLIISELDLQPIESYSQFVQRDYAKVMAEEKRQKRIKKVEIQPVEEFVEIEIEQPIVIEPVVEEATAHEGVKQENE